MDPKLYTAHQNLEDSHWWFTGRRRILSAVAERFNLFTPESKVLDAGCGTGGTLRWLESQAIQCDGFDPVAPDTLYGRLPFEIPFEAESFNVVLALDVLEHIEDDKRTLESIRTLLRPNGTLILTVPAFQSLWSAHDTINHHYRRYRKKPLITLLEKSGFRVQYASYFNTILFPAITLMRKIRPNNEDDLHTTKGWVNKFLTGVLTFEAKLIHFGARLPFGVSLIVIARREW